MDFSQATVGVSIGLSKSGGQAQRIFAPTSNATLALKGTIENVIGSPQADLVKGNSTANRLEGRGGNDTLYGNAGNDTLDGGDGDDRAADVVFGGEGYDWFFQFAKDRRSMGSGLGI